eukprot:c4884_g1_i1.p1 GENE.c4884_g1_i1~~c4884_g1_i1.p1  ORF type:complete len:295 (+),score=39.25 c4884_g1_i1:117-1001(+)
MLSSSSPTVQGRRSSRMRRVPEKLRTGGIEDGDVNTSPELATTQPKPPPPPQTDPENDYEVRRKLNIQRNLSFLNSLSISKSLDKPSEQKPTITKKKLTPRPFREISLRQGITNPFRTKNYLAKLARTISKPRKNAKKIHVLESVPATPEKSSRPSSHAVTKTPTKYRRSFAPPTPKQLIAQLTPGFRILFNPTAANESDSSTISPLKQSDLFPHQQQCCTSPIATSEEEGKTEQFIAKVFFVGQKHILLIQEQGRTKVQIDKDELEDKLWSGCAVLKDKDGTTVLMRTNKPRN